MTEFTKNVFSEPSEPFLVGYVVEGAAARFRICQQKKSIWQFRRSRPNPNNDFPPLLSPPFSDPSLSPLSSRARGNISPKTRKRPEHFSPCRDQG